MAQAPDRTEQLYAKMGEPSWLVLRALQLLHSPTRVALSRQIATTQTAVDPSEGKAIDPSTLHYALKRMIADGIVEELAAPGTHKPATMVAEATVSYRTRGYRPTYGLTLLGRQLLQLRQRRISLEVLMDTPILNRPKPTIFGIASSGDGNLSERASNERPKPRDWRS
ncbi:MAG: hypothetical protein EXR52_03440 [Dehalococcoidia bacterium]|nr:hypothetical protein [Dehalococcoidia bacterium]